MDTLPKISVLTLTTKSRSKFAESMCQNIMRQDYPHDLIEWIVFGEMDDETSEMFNNIFKNIPRITCRYVKCDINGDIGAKRNFASLTASHKIMINQDSDDFYCKTYITDSVTKLRNNKMGIVGSRDMLIFYPKAEGKMVMIRGSSIHEATMCYTKKHWRANRYKRGMKAEGSTMVRGKFFNEMDISRLMICIAHSSNSFDKIQFLDRDEVSISNNQRELLQKAFLFV